MKRFWIGNYEIVVSKGGAKEAEVLAELMTHNSLLHTIVKNCLEIIDDLIEYMPPRSSEKKMVQRSLDRAKMLLGIS